jgi:hypothetical protein
VTDAIAGAAIYAQPGFRDVASYTMSPVEATRFLELELGDG